MVALRGSELTLETLAALVWDFWWLLSVAMVRESKFRGKALEKSRKRKIESEQRPSRGLLEAGQVYT
jgi:hypothetical protein